MHGKRLIFMEPKDSIKDKLIKYDSQQEELPMDLPNLYNTSPLNVNLSKIITSSMNKSI